MSLIRAVLLVLIVALFAFAGPVAADHYAYDLDCYQFASHADAQATYEHILTTDGWDWMNLDDDSDGIACECLLPGSYYACWRP
jgi:hypothetical protein